MKNIKTKILLSTAILLSVFGLVGIASAASSSLYIAPASLTKAVGDFLGLSVGVGASGNKICAVEGVLVFNNLSCQNITVASDVMSQSMPSCSNPHFLIGIPGCTTINKTLFTVSAKTVNSGVASVNFTGVDLIGEGTSIGSASTAGNYTIKAVPKVTPTPTPTPTQTPEITTPETEQELTEVFPVEMIIAEGPNPLLATISSAITLGTGNNIVGIIILFSIGLIIYLAYPYLRRKKKTK
jgi:hypothetical protein